ncbi:uncharacterized protein TNCV_2151431 [Trichonephila clavipes]|uniref:Uncharacterized protein n=1 Tax=Trichonephila clavipes TaxID=2585209 RepID=A0A8X6UZ08_TRICX|nr:uncharacterized protein TNCV_2151431 [Trichonephila clavipes]
MLSYPNSSPSAIRHLPHGHDIPMPLPPTELQKFSRIAMNKLEKFQELGCSMSVKIHFSPETLGLVSEEQGKRFHQGIKDMERKYQGRTDKNMLVDYCWMLNEMV